MNKYTINIKYCIKIIMYEDEHHNLKIDIRYKYKVCLTTNLMCHTAIYQKDND